MRTRNYDLTDEQRAEIADAHRGFLRWWLSQGNHCIHRPAGQICADCRADHAEDPDAWMEYGDHEAGLANWKALQEEIAQEAGLHCQPILLDDPNDPSIPF